MYGLKKINELLEQEQLPTVSRQMFSRMRGITYKVKRMNKEYESKPILIEDVHYQVEKKGKKPSYLCNDEGIKVIRQWAIEKRSKEQARRKPDVNVFREWIQVNAKMLIDQYSENGRIQYKSIETEYKNREFPTIPIQIFRRILRESLSFANETGALEE